MPDETISTREDFSGHHGKDRAPAPGRLRLVEQFLNTISGLRGGADLIAQPDGLADWLKRRDLTPDGAVEHIDVQRAIDLREALRAWLSKPDAAPSASASTIERAAIDAQLGLRLVDEGDLRLMAGARGVDGALGAILVALYDGLVEGTARRLRVCRNPACRWVFYDHSRNGAARWCSMNVCGSRAKVREYRQRQSADQRQR